MEPVMNDRDAVAQLTDTGDPESAYEWTVEGESYHPHSSDEWRIEDASGTVEATSAGAALVKIITGQGAGTTLENTIPWDVIDQDRPITITIRPEGGAGQ